MEGYLDPKQFYASELESWELLWNNELSLFDNVENLISNSVFLPRKDICNKVVAIYAMMPSKWSKVAGILFSFGDQGSGKSTIANLINRLHGKQYTFSPTDTFASIRNALDKMRWTDVQTKEFEEEGCILCWDNISRETLLRDNKIYQLLLFGYNRNNDKISIASSDGTNREYFVYCPKILSSVEPIHLDSKFVELRRRLIVIPHKPFDKFSFQEKQLYKDVDINNDRIDIDAINWEGIQSKYFDFWSDKANCTLYVYFRNELTKRTKKQFKLPKSITGEKWTITVDLIATAMVLQAFDTLQDGVDFFTQYWQYSDTQIYGEFSATLEHLRLFIEEEIGTLRDINEKFVLDGKPVTPLIISPARLKSKITELQSRGELDITPKTHVINDLMYQLGWKLSTKGWVERL